MKSVKRFSTLLFALVFVFPCAVSHAGGQDYSGQEDPNKKIIKQGILGAATGAIASEASGGEAGKGALVGAGTNVIGGALLDTLTAPPARPQPQYVQQAPVVQQAPQYAQQQAAYPVQPAYRQEPVYAQQPVYYPPAAEDPNKRIIKQGLLGAGTGAIAASASGGKAGKGALIGAGTNIIGGALLDSLTGSPQPQSQPVYYQQAPPQYAPQYQQQYPGTATSSTQPRKKIVRRYDADGNVVSEEEVWE